MIRLIVIKADIIYNTNFKMTNSKQRLRLAHQLLDRQLENSTVSKKSFTADDSTKPWSFEIKKQSTGKSQISELQRKLMDLEKKMEDIECSSDNEEPQIFLKKLSRSREKSNKKPVKHVEIQLDEEEDSADDNLIYKRLQNLNKKKDLQSNHIQEKKRVSLAIKQSTGSLPGSVKSRKLSHSQTSKNKKDNSSHKMMRSSSKKSIRSNKSIQSSSMKQLQLQNLKDTRKISNLQKQLERYKRLYQKQKQKLEDYRVMEIQHKKLQVNFNKSQQIRKQQKKIIEGLKFKH